MTSWREGGGFIPVGVDTLGPVVREYLKAIFRNVMNDRLQLNCDV